MNTPVRTRLSKGVLTIGLVALSTAALIAHYSPATGYELSIYRTTPPAFWIALFISLLASVVISLAAERRFPRSLALWLGGISITLFSALPLVRGYYFFGQEDALTHLGNAKDLAAGLIGLTDVLYPAIHSLSVVLQYITGQNLARMLLLVVPIFVAVFIVFIPLCVRAITDRRRIDSTAVLSAMLLLPLIILYLPVLQPSPTSQAIFFVPAATFVLLAYLNRHRKLAFGMPLALALVFLLVLHPQHALVFVALLVIALFVHSLSKILLGDTRDLPGIAFLSVQFIIVAAASLAVLSLWLDIQSASSAQFTTLARRLFPVESLAELRAFLATEPTGQVIAALFDNPSYPIIPRSDTLSRLGVSVRTLYLRVFAVKIVYGVFALLALFVPAISWLAKRRGIRYPVVVSLVCGLVPVSVIIALYVLAGVPNQYYRYLGFVLVFVTILGAVFLREARAALEGVGPTVAVRGLLVVLFVGLLVFSSFAMFRSPYIYQPTEHVPRGQVSGYETAFTYGAEEIPFAGVDSPIYRYHAGIYGAESESVPTAPFDNPRSSGRYSRVPPHFGNQSLRTQVEQPIYLTVTASDRQSSTRLYGGADFSRADFRYLDTTPGIAKVLSNGQFDLYLVHPINTTNN